MLRQLFYALAVLIAAFGSTAIGVGQTPPPEADREGVGTGAAVLQNAEALRSASAADLRQALLNAEREGMTASKQHEILYDWITTSDRLAEAGRGDLLYLYEAVKGAGGEHSQAQAKARQTLVEDMQRRIEALSDASATTTQVFETVFAVRAGFELAEPAQRQELVERLAEQLSSTQIAERFAEGQLRQSVSAVLSSFGDQRYSARLQTAWLAGGGRWQDLSAAQLATLYIQLQELNAQDVDQQLSQILKQATADAATLTHFAAVLAKKDPHVLKQDELAQRLWNELDERLEGGAVLTANAAVWSVRFLAAAYADQPEVLRERTASLLVDDQRIEREFAPFTAVGQALIDADLVEPLREHLTAKDGQVRLNLSKALSWAYSLQQAKSGAALDEWRQYLTRRAEEPGLEPDVRASWLLARSYAAAVVPAENTYRVNAFDWAERALAEARSEPMIAEALGWLGEQYAEVGEYDQALSLIQSVSHQIESPEPRQSIEQMKQRLQVGHHMAQQRAKGVEYQRELSRLKGQLQIMQRHLQDAKQQDKPTEDIHSIERVIEQIEAELARHRDAGPPEPDRFSGEADEQEL